MKLKTCPFCGKAPTLLTKNEGIFFYFHIFCTYKYCIVKPYTAWECDNNYTFEGFVEMWNTRYDTETTVEVE